MPTINSVMAISQFRIVAAFDDGLIKVYDMHRLLSDIPQFEALQRNAQDFFSLRRSPGGYGVIWNDELDLAAEEIYENGLNICL